MKVLVTGGAGYVGSVIVETLVDRGHSVIAIDNLQAGHRLAVHPDAEFYECDLSDLKRLDEIFRLHSIYAVVHMAAEALIAESVVNPRPFFERNVGFGLGLLRIMLANGVKRIVFSSTAAVYGEPESVPIRECAPQKPVNPYGESKRMFEQILYWYYKAYGLIHVCLRYFNACGASGLFGEQHTPETHLMPLVLQVAAGIREKVEIFGTDYDTPDGTCIRDYIHVLDLADAHARVLESLDNIGGGAFNLGNGNGYSVLEVIRTARCVTGHEIPITIVGRRSGDPAQLIASSEQIRRQLDWQPRHSDLRNIIETAWRWSQAHPKGYQH